VSVVAQANSTYAAIERLVRELTACPNEASLSSAYIQDATNTFYSQDFPYAIKIDQLRSVYTFITQANIDRYPLDINSNQSMRDPVYFEGILGTLYKDRNTFYNMWPRFPTQFKPISGDGVTTSFTFTIQGPFLSKEVVLGGIDANGFPIKIQDDGGRNTYQGNLLYITTNNVGNAVPPTPNTSPIPPATPLPTNAIGTVNYLTGVFNINFPVAPAAGTQVTLWVSQYQSGRPYSILYWNSEFQIRPVPDGAYKVEIESYMTPVQFMQTTDNPTLNQWWQYIAYGVAREILRRRQDMEGVENLKEGFMRQEALVLERQANEEIGQRNSTIFSAPMYQGQNWGNGYGWW
jgi:hypothetical protein